MRNLAIIIIIAVLYVFMAKLSQLLFYVNGITPVWPPAGIALASLLLFGNVALIAIFIGCYISNFHLFTIQDVTFFSFLFALIPPIGATLQAYVGKLFMKYVAGTYELFKNIHTVLVFIFLSGFVACLINATLGTSLFIWLKQIPTEGMIYYWLIWWIEDAVGVVMITSTFLAWFQKDDEYLSPWMLFKLLITWFLIALFGAIIVNSKLQIAFLLIPFAIWSAFQFPIRFSILSGLLISAICLYDSAYGNGIIETTSVLTAILMTQIFISIIYLIILLINTILSDRKKAYDNLQTLNIQLEQRVLDRTKELSSANQQLEIQKNKITEAYEALKQSYARLMQSEKMASLGILTAGVAHEIKNLLNAIVSNMKSIETNINTMINFLKPNKEVNDIKEASNLLLIATNEGIKRTAGIVTDLHAFARSDEPEMVVSDLHRNIDATLNLLSSESKHIKIIKEYGDIPPFLCHPGKLNQVIMNILINAIHVLQSQSDAKIMIKTTVKDDSVILSIKDNGKGMSKEVADNIFVPFFTTKKSGMGSGLGLFISSNIIKEHNGKISVISEPNIGTEFLITIPLK